MTSPQSPYGHGGHVPGPSYYHQPPPVYSSSSPGPNPHYPYQYPPPPPPPHHHPGPSRPNGRGGGPYNPRNQPHNPYAYYPPYHAGPVPMQPPNPHPYPRNQPYSPSPYAYLNPAAVPFTPPRHTPQPASPSVPKQRPFYEPAAIPIASPRAQKPAAPPRIPASPQPEAEAVSDQLGPSTGDEQGPSSSTSAHQMGSIPKQESPPPISFTTPESIDPSPSFSFATSEPTDPTPPISFTIWSRRPRDPSHAPGIIISPRACPPPKLVDEALDSNTPPISPPLSPVAARKKKLPINLPDAVTPLPVSRETTFLDAAPHSQTSSTVPSSAVTESAGTPTIPGSPATTNTSVSTAPLATEVKTETKEEPIEEAAPIPASNDDSSTPAPVPSDEKKVVGPQIETPSALAPEPAASSSAAPTHAPAPATPPVKKSWASLLRPTSSSASPASSTKNALPTSSIVGFSIPADAPSAAPAQSVSPGRKNELLNLLMSPPSTTPFAPRIRPRGLVNSGNMCFANAVLQILVYCPPFHRLFVELGKSLPSVAVASEREREKEREREWAGLPTTNGVTSSTSTSSASSKSSPSSTPLVDATSLFLKEFLDKKKKPKSKENGAFSRAGKGKERELIVDDDADDDWDTVDSFLPTYIYDAMKEKKRFDTMRGGQQEDAEEFLGFYLDTLEEELLLLLNSVTNEKAETAGGEEKKEEGWLEVGKKNRLLVTRTVKAAESPITRIFGGKFRSTLHAPRQKDSVVVEDWRSLRLDIQPDTVHTISDALAYISHPQHVQLSIPTQPGVPVDATQTVFIESLPPIMVLHIKRFEYDVKVGGVVKVGKQVRFEEELVVDGELMAPAAKKANSGPARYKLFGVLYHHGLSASGGHYTLDVLHPNRYASFAVPATAASAVSGVGALRPREGWIRIDDDLVSDVHLNARVPSHFTTLGSHSYTLLGLNMSKPGHGHPLTWAPEDGLLPNALVDIGFFEGLFKIIPLRELTMLGFMNAVTDKPEWTKKARLHLVTPVLDDKIVLRWNNESVKTDVRVQDQMTQRMFDYCIQELRHRVGAQGDGDPYRGAIHVFPASVYKSDSAVTNEVQNALREAVKSLEDVPEQRKDWHPGSDGKVLDLVHPSLFPLVYGRSRVLALGSQKTTLADCVKRCGEGEVVPVPNPEEFTEGLKRIFKWRISNLKEPTKAYSMKFQWLPCDVDISGDKPRITSYINNLYPKSHRELYHVIEDVIAAALPLWSLSLAPLKSRSTYSLPRRIDYRKCEFDPDPEATEPYPQQRNGEEYNDYITRADAWWDWVRETRRVVIPDAPEVFTPLEEPKPWNLKDELGQRPLQVIVKLANIELTPEKPEYEGGTWHVEGQLNEAICATAIYYYSSENITTSSLAFRQQSRDPDYDDVRYRQHNHDWLYPVFGLVQEGPTIQNLGSVETREGRLITFPNVLQHQVQPFKLADPTKPGHRKILALFLVDPTTLILSTADVPPQRLDWWEEELSCGNAIEVDPKHQDRWTDLPRELKDQVFAGVEGFPIDLETAKKFREELMEERKRFILGHQQDFSATQISLCEH